MPKEYSKATAIFLDMFKLNLGKANKKLLAQLSTNFAALPWENLSKYVRKHGLADKETQILPESLKGIEGAQMLRLSTEVLEDHSNLGTGGTCFSLTNALMKICSDLGFTAAPAMADMRYGENIHCGLVVYLDGKRYLLDPGYLVGEPIELVTGQKAVIGSPGHQLEYRPIEGKDEFELYTKNGRGEEVFRYRLRPQPIGFPQFLHHWIESFHTNGMNGLHLNALSAEGRLSAHNLNLRVDTGMGKKNIKLRQDYVETISKHFGLSRQLVQLAFAEWEKRRWKP